jgi:hypothetical protein
MQIVHMNAPELLPLPSKTVRLGRFRLRRTREAYLKHENAKTELKGLMPEDAKKAIDPGQVLKRISPVRRGPMTGSFTARPMSRLVAEAQH